MEEEGKKRASFGIGMLRVWTTRLTLKPRRRHCLTTRMASSKVMTVSMRDSEEGLAVQQI